MRPRSVHEDVQLSVLFGRLNGGKALVTVCNVKGACERVPTGVPDRSGDLLESVGACSRKTDRTALARKSSGYRFADAAACPGDQRDLAGKAAGGRPTAIFNLFYLDPLVCCSLAWRLPLRNGQAFALGERRSCDGRGNGPAFFQMVLGVLWAAPATVETILYQKSLIPPGSLWVAFGIGRQQMPIVE